MKVRKIMKDIREQLPDIFVLEDLLDILFIVPAVNIVELFQSQMELEEMKAVNENLYGIDASNAAEKLSTLNYRSGYPSSISVDQLWTWSIISDPDSPYYGWPELNVVRTNP